MRRASVLTLVALVSCSRDSTPTSARPPLSSAASPAPSVSPLASRPYVLHAPPTHDARAPLLVLLHGYGGDHADIASGLGAVPLADAHGAFLALPDGTRDRTGSRFWNATDACCDFGGTRVDDVAYLDALIDDALSRFPIDPKRVFVAGFSNGGFMAHRYACDRAPRVAAIAAFAGDPWKDPTLCVPSVPVSVLQVHGDADPVVQYGGGRVYDAPGFHRPELAAIPPFPAARDGVAMWARLDGCGDPTVADTPREADLRYAGCGGGAEVQLWTLHGAAHSLGLRPDDMERVWAFLSAHALP